MECFRGLANLLNRIWDIRKQQEDKKKEMEMSVYKTDARKKASGVMNGAHDRKRGHR